MNITGAHFVFQVMVLLRRVHKTKSIVIQVNQHRWSFDDIHQSLGDGAFADR